MNSLTTKLHRSFFKFSSTVQATRKLSVTLHRSSNTSTETSTDTPKTFQELLDESPLMKFGRAPGKCVIGKIIDICNDDLYVDFGGKFEAVVKRPETASMEEYQKNTLVRLILNKFEMTGAFLGDERHITVCEADALLLGPYIDPKTHTEKKKV